MDSLSLGNKQLIPTTWRIFDRYSERRQLLFCWHVLLEVVNNWSLLSDCIARYGLPLPKPCTVPSYCLLYGIQWKSWTCSWCSPSERAQYFRCLPLYDKVHGNEVCSFNLISFGFYESHLWGEINFYFFPLDAFLFKNRSDSLSLNFKEGQGIVLPIVCRF